MIIKTKTKKCIVEVVTLTDTVMNTTALPEVLFSLIKTEKVRIKEDDGVIQLLPIQEKPDCTIGLRGILAGNASLTVNSYLERKQQEKELDL